ncbi:MAG: chalcone isomerase family protein [Bacteroidia bacterium]|nr:chalcone isomerase family protein [Bacteroidia bacterium]
MKTLFFSTIFIFSLSFAAHTQTVVSGISVPNSLKNGETTLTLNGAGTREKYFMDMYVGGLYLKTKQTDADKIMSTDEPMAITLRIVSSLISSEKMVEAVDEGFKKSSKANLTVLNDRVTKFKNLFMREPIKKGDIYEIVYIPGSGTHVSKNGKALETIIGLDFKKGLFGIWLCNDPADQDLKKAMLGGK